MNYLYNAIQTPDGTILESRHRHDYKTYKDTLSGEVYMVDGGFDYLRRSCNHTPSKELSIPYVEGVTPIDISREHFTWGSYGKNGKGIKRPIKLKNLSNKHIENILATQYHISEAIRKLFKSELSFREMYNINIEDNY